MRFWNVLMSSIHHISGNARLVELCPLGIRISKEKEKKASEGAFLIVVATRRYKVSVTNYLHTYTKKPLTHSIAITIVRGPNLFILQTRTPERAQSLQVHTQLYTVHSSSNPARPHPPTRVRQTRVS